MTEDDVLVGGHEVDAVGELVSGGDHHRVERRERVAWIHLDRPEALNALNAQLMRELVAVATELDADDGVGAICTFVGVTICSDIGGYVAGVLFGKHPMAPVISPKKSWEGFAGSLVFCVAAGVALVVWFLDGAWWVGVLLGLIAVVMATLGDLCESVMKRDLGIKDMSQIIPGHGGLMDRLDSLLATVAPIWLVLYYLVF